ncbi:MAG: Mur ligase family protein [Candidatus Saccharibacteria bacterium]|nr:Mur ligase family protein [Candidatus Saccharibacteria bacterium]
MSDKTEDNSKHKSHKGMRVKARLLDTYYGHVSRDMKLIVITGSTGKVTTAHFVHSILAEAGEHVAVLASDDEIKVGMLHKFLSDAWKAGASYIVVTAPAKSIASEVFFKLPIHVVALTDYVPSHLEDATAADYEAATDTLFDMDPEITVVNSDDINYKTFRSFKGTKASLTYGHDYYASVRIEGSQLYKKGTEAQLNIDGHRETVASFCPGEPVVAYMACAAAIANALKIDDDTIIAGIAAYEPEA